MTFNISLLHYRAKIYGIILIIISVICAYMYFWGGKPEFFYIKVFALISVYLETRSFVLIQTNILDELAAILFITGIVIFSFSEEKHEKESNKILRGKAFIYSIFITLAIWILSFLLIYGMAIFVFSASVFILFFIIYNITFRIFLLKQKISEYKR